MARPLCGQLRAFGGRSRTRLSGTAAAGRNDEALPQRYERRFSGCDERGRVEPLYPDDGRQLRRSGQRRLSRYLPRTGAPSYAALLPNFAFRNQAGKKFADVTAATGTGHLQKGHGVAFGDIDNDGDEDI